MTCEEFKTRLDAYIDGELTNEERSDLERHAQECASCADELRYAKAIAEALRNLDETTVPPLAAQAAWRDAIRRESRSSKFRKFYKYFGAAAAAVVVLGLSFAGFRTLNGKEKSAVPAPDEVFTYVATDSAEESAPVAASAQATASVKLKADDPEQAAQTVLSVLDEFDGEVVSQNVTSGGAYLTVSLNAADWDEFLQALSYAGEVESTSPDGEGSVLLSLSIQK